MSRRAHAQGGYWYAHAIWESDLPPTSRLVALIVNGIADNSTGQVKVSLTTIAQRTGLGRSTVARALNGLEEQGWMKRARPEAWRAIRLHDATVYTTLIPPGFPVKASPTAGLGNGEAGPRTGLGLVPETTNSGPTAGHSSTRTKGAGARSARATRTPRLLVGEGQVSDAADLTPWDVALLPNELDSGHVEISAQPALWREHATNETELEAGYEDFRVLARIVARVFADAGQTLQASHRCGDSIDPCGLDDSLINDKEPVVGLTVPAAVCDAWMARIADVLRDAMPKEAAA